MKTINGGDFWRTDDQEMNCINLRDHNMCDMMHSMKIFDKAHAPALGSWKGFTGSGDIEIEITQGFSSTSTV